MFKRSSTMQFHLLVFMATFVLCSAGTSEIQNVTQAASSECGENEKTLALLDITKDCISRAAFFYPDCVEDALSCKKKEKSLAFLDVAMNVISEVKKSYSACPNTVCPKNFERLMDCSECRKHVERPIDCSDILRSGKNESGVYTIWPNSRIFTNKSLAVYCDMDTDGGGWTVIQRRGRFPVPKDYFYKDWESYKNGFGNLTEEFWIGNDNINAITTQAFVYKPYKIRFDLKDALGKAGYAEYDSFWIEDEAAKYTLHINGYKGNIGDSMTLHDKKMFSTKDRDNDASSGSSCAETWNGAWWYNNCGYSNLNGLYQPGIASASGCIWYHFAKSYMGLSGSEIKLRS